MTNEKTRAGSIANRDRAALYRAANGRVKDAIGQGFPLEAVGLLESMICDRLESHIQALTTKPGRFNMLRPLITLVTKEDPSPEMTDLATRLDAWRLERNRVVHEMAKISIADAGQVNWHARNQAAASTARRGQQLLRDLDRHVRASRRRNGATAR